MKILALLIILFSCGNAFSKNFEVYNCAKKKDEIINALKLFPTCNVDDDCRYFDYGYPWQPNSCTKAIVSKSQENKSLKYLNAIEEYNQNCVYSYKSEKRKFRKFAKNLKNSQCNNLPRLFCLKGVCRNQYYPLIFDDAGSIR